MDGILRSPFRLVKKHIRDRGGAMYVLQSQERVFVQGRPGLFVVLRVHQDRRLVDLIEIGAEAVGLEENVPLAVIRPFRENLPMEER